MRKLEVMPAVRGIGATIGAHKLLILAVLVGLLLLILLAVLLIYLRRKSTPAVAPAAAPPPPPQPDTKVLRAAWQRFLKGLPREYRRSILNFDHFVVMGAPAAGKTRLIDAYSDWKRQTKEFASSQPNDPDLPVYLASSEVIVELPARILEDHSGAVYQALNRLWRPIYRERAPTVVAVVDVVRLMESAPNAVVDLAEKIRGKVNVLSTIRGKPIEVRVALTHLDEMEGFKELAEFCRDHEIPLRVAAPAAGSERPDLGRHMEGWFDDLRGYLPNALVSLASAEFRRIVSFMGRAPQISTALRPFLKALFQHEAVVADPIFGGILFASESPGVTNPLQGAYETGPGPDPQRTHLWVAGSLGVAGVLYLGVAFEAQYSRWSTASEALDKYSPNDGAEVEPFRRAEVTAFTSKKTGWVAHHPDFFADERHEMRKRFSDRIRTHYFIKRLTQEVLKNGTLRKDGVRMAARRSVYYLGLIHSDKNDHLRILDPGQPEIWASMLELRRDGAFFADYLANIDVAYKTPIDFQFSDPITGVDPNDGSRGWVELLDQLDRALSDGTVSQSELHDLQKHTKELGPRLSRFDNDAVMRRVLNNMDTAAGSEHYIDGERQRPGPLETYYQRKFAAFLQGVAWAEDPDLLRALRRVVDTVNATAIEVAAPRTLAELVFRLEQLYSADADPPDDGQAVKIRIDGTERKLPSGKWAQILRDSKAEQYIESFLAGSIDQNTLFAPDVVASLPPVRWNPNGDGAAVFVGRGVLDGRYTKLAYDKHIREMVLRLSAVLAKTNIGNDVRTALTVAVNDQITRYAARYREEALRFAQSFDVQASSQEALRVALAQMTNDVSAFNDFLVALDQNTRLATPVPLLSSVRTEMATFDSWHLAVEGGGGAPEIGKYKAILGQLLVDLAAASAAAGAPPAAASATPAAAGGAAAPDSTPDTLEKSLSPVGRLYLAELRGEKGSYGVLVENWLSSIHMPENQRKPFRAPLRRLAELGRHDIERAVARVWHVEMLPSLQHIAVRFPFNRAAKEEVSPQELHELFHPKDGRLFELFRRWVEPLAELSGRGGFHPRPAVVRGLSLPPGLFTAFNAAAALSTRLWDSSGNPVPLEQRISTVRFERSARLRGGEERKDALTLMYLNVGEGSVFNFNQQPSLVTIGFDWTKDHRSQVGVQLTDTATKENSFPAPIVSSGHYWSFYNLLLRAQVSPVKSPPTAQLYTWEVWNQPDSAPGEMIRVRFVLVNDPWEPFAAIGHFAPRPKDPPREARKDIPKEPVKIPPTLPAPLKRMEAL